jgi:short subunit dehydrogenase-like uncharacterized protein
VTPWLIYGANGYTGELIAREAVRRGHRPILAGRNAESVEKLAKELGCESRVFALDGAKLEGVSLVVHCAGPFSETSKPMVDACLATKAHYVDITGEIAVFESIMRRDEEAKSRGVTLLPGAGFDVVPTDCLAAILKERMPDAVELRLAFYTKGGRISRGTMRTSLESLGDGGAIRVDGKIVRVKMAHDVRDIPFSCGTRTAMTIPWGDVSTAFYTTGIPNIRVYMAQRPQQIKMARLISPILPLLSPKPMRRLLRGLARSGGPDESQRKSGRIYLWGEVTNARGEKISMTMTTPEGYAFTTISTVNAVEEILRDPTVGAFTPARLFGAQFVFRVPGVVIDA